LERIFFSDILHDWQVRNSHLLDWIVIGGESGPKRRDCGVDDIVALARTAKECGVKVFVKQDCALYPGQQGRIPNDIWELKEFPAGVQI